MREETIMASVTTSSAALQRTPLGKARSHWLSTWLPGPRHALRHAVSSACRRLPLLGQWKANTHTKKLRCSAASVPLSGSGSEPWSSPTRGREDESRQSALPAHVLQVLDLKPELSPVDAVLALGLGAAAAAAAWLIRRTLAVSATSSEPVAKALALVCGFAVALIYRSLALERQHARAALSPMQAADADSRFVDIGGVQVHHKLVSDATGVPVAWACVHGFGSNEGTWGLHGILDSLIRQRRLGSIAVAHDMPGFGLSQRCTAVRDYSLGTAARMTAQLMATLVAKEQASRLVLMGHSLGGLVAVRAAAQCTHPKVVGLVLVAPAVIAQGTTPPRPRPRALAVVAALCSAAILLPLALFAPLLQFAALRPLRGAVRNVDFWRSGLRGAFVAKDLVSARLVDVYRRPACVTHWDLGLLKFVASRLVPDGIAQVLANVVRVFRGEVSPDQLPGSVALAELVRAGVHVLIVHGDGDALVPVSNSVRLARQIPGVRLAVLPQCGHSPQEEQPDALLDAVEKWSRDIAVHAVADSDGE